MSSASAHCSGRDALGHVIWQVTFDSHHKIVQQVKRTSDLFMMMCCYVWRCAAVCLHQQAADTAAIRAAITEEARSHGIEHTLKEDRPPVARRGLRLPADLLSGGNEQLLQLLQQVFDGQLPGMQLNINAGGQNSEGGEGGEAQAEEVRKGTKPLFEQAKRTKTCQQGSHLAHHLLICMVLSEVLRALYVATVLLFLLGQTLHAAVLHCCAVMLCHLAAAG